MIICTSLLKPPPTWACPGENGENHLIFTSLWFPGGLGEHSLSLLHSLIFRHLKGVQGREWADGFELSENQAIKLLVTGAACVLPLVKANIETCLPSCQILLFKPKSILTFWKLAELYEQEYSSRTCTWFTGDLSCIPVWATLCPWEGHSLSTFTNPIWGT